MADDPVNTCVMYARNKQVVCHYISYTATTVATAATDIAVPSPKL